MPSVRGIPGAYRYFFYSFDCNEPPHVHVKRESMTCKFWLAPVDFAGNDGFSAHELMQIRRLLLSHESLLLEAWNEHCGH
jgi:hypothetical protein